MKRPLFSGLAALAVLSASPLSADIRLPAILSDRMVLQQDVLVPVWGWADPGEQVRVEIGGQTKETVAGPDGRWSVKLAKLKAGEGLSLVVKGKNKVTINDVLVGEVWLCSGQSNMAMSVRSSKDFEQEKAQAKFPQIRMFTVERNSRPAPVEDCRGRWEITTPENVGFFSATAYFFGREVHQKLGVPVGLINTSWGGTSIEAWTSMEAQSRLKEYPVIAESWVKATATPFDAQLAQAQYAKQKAAHADNVKKAKAAGKAAPRAPQPPQDPRLNQNYPANLYNGMIAPLLPYALRGGIWYQGENNANKAFANLYALQLETMIRDWRTRWGIDFPFAWVQLPDFRAPQKEAVEPSGWVTVREQMLKGLSIPKTGMAITLGLGEENDIHPKNKQDVGRRLAMWALAEVYRQKGVTASGPLPAGHRTRGSEIVLNFKHTDGGLKSSTPQLKGFAIAGEDKKWVRAEARIEGDRVVVSNPGVKRPVAVRYAWAQNPEFSLFNGAGLPATPFRTDDWE